MSAKNVSRTSSYDENNVTHIKNNYRNSSNCDKDDSLCLMSFRSEQVVQLSNQKKPEPKHSSSNRNIERDVKPSSESNMSFSGLPLLSSPEEETKTATIRGRMKLSRTSLTLDLEPNSNSNSSLLSRSSFDPTRSQRSLSPDTSEHIYEELPSQMTTTVDSLRNHVKVSRPRSIYASQPDLSNSSNSLRTISNPPSSGGMRRNKLSHVQTLPPGFGKSLFDGASKSEILEILKSAKNRLESSGSEDGENTEEFPTREVTVADSPDESPSSKKDPSSFMYSRYHSSRNSNISSSSESSEENVTILTEKDRLVSGKVERTDSGVGSETSKTVELHKPLTHVTEVAGPVVDGPLVVGAGSVPGVRNPEMPVCEDCDATVDTRLSNSGVVYAPLVCRRCFRRRQERREIISEIVETELKYSRDLKIIIDQFYRPIEIAGLLSNNQLDSVFLNVAQLYAESLSFYDQLQDALEHASEQQDSELLSLDLAKLFLEADTMMDAFEFYCVRQGEASMALQSLEKEKELLRVFLRVSQMENTLLRRMNLHSFLMVPVQRVTKYPLLLSRLQKATPTQHESRQHCRAAQQLVERRLHLINSETKEGVSSKLWRRISMSVAAPRVPTRVPACPARVMLELVLTTLSWPGGRIAREGLLYTLSPDPQNWTLRGRPPKLQALHVLLAVKGVNAGEQTGRTPHLISPGKLCIEEAALVALKSPLRHTKQALYKEPWVLSNSIVSWDTETNEHFEVMDITSKDSYFFKGSDASETLEWFRMAQLHALSVGSWKKRRMAMHNIMISAT